jgi:2,3,4,5-tetrahydropyridine-2-carboxylate N-succinyltransferase
MDELEGYVASAYANRSLLNEIIYRDAIEETISLLDQGQIRVAEPVADQIPWKLNEWVKKAILLYFSIKSNEPIISGGIEYFDKIPLKSGFEWLKVRVVPPAVARYGSYLAPNTILMPSYVNIGAFVGSGTMVDTWATVGSCAQIGENVHISGGVGIGGVLEPPQASPVIVEDGVFVGSRCILVEGVRIGKEAVLGANVVITASTRIIDVTGTEAKETKGYVPPRSVVIPGSVEKQFAAGKFMVPCALIIGSRSESTDLKTSLNQALREFSVAV